MTDTASIQDGPSVEMTGRKSPLKPWMAEWPSAARSVTKSM